MRKIFLLLLLTIFLMPNIAKATEAYDYISDVVRGFDRLKIADERLKSSDNDEAVLFMKNIILFNSEINSAAQFIKPHILSNNEVIKKSASLFYEIYLSIIENNENDLSIYEKALNNPKDFPIGTLTRKISETMAINEKLWRGLPDATVVSTYTLVDNKRPENGKLTYLTITSKEKESVMHQLVKVYGEGIKGGPKGGQFPIEISGALLYSFFNNGHKPSDVK